MTANRDIMSVALAAVYGPDNNLADWEAQHWVAEGFEPCGPGDKAAWYAAEGASGSSYGDLEYDYWTSVFSGGGSTFYILLETGDRLLTEGGDFLRKE